MEEKQEYTIDIHVKRLKEMLELDNLITKCPAITGFSSKESTIDFWKRNPDPCKICTTFVGLIGVMCPCIVMPEKRAVELTKKAIKKYEQT